MMAGCACCCPFPDRDFDVTALADPDRQFERGPVTLSARGTAADDRPAFVVADRDYVSARSPGDAYLFGRVFRDLLASAGSLYRTDRSIRLPSGSSLAEVVAVPGGNVLGAVSWSSPSGSRERT